MLDYMAIVDRRMEARFGTYHTVKMPSEVTLRVRIWCEFTRATREADAAMGRRDRAARYRRSVALGVAA